MASDPLGGSPRRWPELEEERPPLRWWSRWFLAVGAVVVAGVVAWLLIGPGGGHAHSATGAERSPTVARLPAGARPLPGDPVPDTSRIGILRTLRPSSAYISRAQALRVYDRSSGGASRSGRLVYTTLAELAYVDATTVKRGAFWVISVWYHPGYAGTGPDTWCVDYGLVGATPGASAGHLDDCPLPVGAKPRRVTAGG